MFRGRTIPPASSTRTALPAAGQRAPEEFDHAVRRELGMLEKELEQVQAEHRRVISKQQPLAVLADHGGRLANGSDQRRRQRSRRPPESTRASFASRRPRTLSRVTLFFS